ncbi:MAG: radical SAM protein [Caldithrix sp.]|nr:radical SAM protein [Caldithrix sp.]
MLSNRFKRMLQQLGLYAVPLRSAIRSAFIVNVRYTPKRVFNYSKVILSMYLSKWLKRPIIWGLPPIIMVEPTNICNLKCPMCPSGNGDMHRPRGKLDLKHFKSIVDDIGDYVFQIQFWNQGEPFINKNFLEFVQYAKEKGIMTQTSTNGHYIRTDEMAETVVKSGLDQIIFSMDGTNSETYAKYRVGGNFDLVIETLGRLTKARTRLGKKTPLIELQFIVFKHNQDEIDRLIEIARENKVNRIAFKTAQVYSEEQAKEYLPEDAQFLRYEFDGQSISMRGEIENWCKRLWLNTTVNWDGSISPCCFDKDADYAMAHLFDQKKSFKEIWKNGDYMQFRKQVLSNRKGIEMCGNCTEGLEEPYARIIEL